MKFIFFFTIIFFLQGCNKTKVLLICGDHVCVNKAEADQYFEENLTIEAKIIDTKKKKNDDLVQLNLKKDQKGIRQVSIVNKTETTERLKSLSKDEILQIKSKIKNAKNERKIAKIKIIENKPNQIESNTVSKIERYKESNNKNITNNVYKKRKNIVDVCTILEKCNIDSITKYLRDQGKNKKFPDITARQ